MSTCPPTFVLMVSGTLNRRAAAMAETRAKLIQAGRQAFAVHGYAAASMDDLTAAAGLTRGALYHHFGDKRGLLSAVIGQIDAEMAERLCAIRQVAPTLWDGLLNEGSGYIEMATDPETRRIMLLDGPAVLGDPSTWPGEDACLRITMQMMQALIDEGTIAVIDVEAAGRLLNGAALRAALWVASADDPKTVLGKAIEAFRRLASGLLIQTH